MTDIVDRLRAPEFVDVAEKYLMEEAAAEIERLRAERNLLFAGNGNFGMALMRANAEIERLRK